MTNEITFEDIFRIISEEVHGEQAEATENLQPSPLMPIGDTAIQEVDLQRLLAEAEKNVKARDGLIGMAMAKLRGNELDRLRYEQMLSTLKASSIAEQTQVAVMLIVSLQILGFKVLVSGIDEMERFGNRFDPNSTSGRMARTLLADNETTLRQLSSHVNATGRNRILKVTGMG